MDIRTLPTAPALRLLRPGDVGYDAARRIWNGAFDRHPALIARCRTTADVVEAVRLAADNDLALAVRGGGHSIPGHSVCDGGLMIDLSPMKAVTVDPVARRAAVQPGVIWREYDAAAQEHGLASPGGEISDTGVAGLTLGGGIGWLTRPFGLACDNLSGAELVTADGEVVQVSEGEHPGLLWGLRGGGGNFGIVTRFEFRVHPVGPVVMGGMVLHGAEHAAEALALFNELAAAAPPRLSLAAALITAPSAPFVPEHLRGGPAVVIGACYAGSVEEGARAVQPLRTSVPPAVNLLGPMPYTSLQQMLDDTAPAHMAAYARSEWLGPLDDRAIAALLDAQSRTTAPTGQILLRHLGGAVRDVPADATAFRYREAEHMLTVASLWPPGEPGEVSHRDWVRDAWSALTPWSLGGGYVNQLGDEGGQRLRDAYGPSTWDRLVQLKGRWDPTNLFRLNQNIPPRR